MDAGYADALMLDYRGLVAEATGANVFFIKGDEVHTPTPDCFLNGITRQTLVDLAKRNGLKVIERHIKPEELGELRRVLPHRHGRRSDAGQRDRRLPVQAGPGVPDADRCVLGGSDAEARGGRVAVSNASRLDLRDD